MLIGYARTSTVEQVAGLEAQEASLLATGCQKLFSEQASSVAQRDQLAVALDPSTSSGEPLCARATRWS
jgi:DNA invertase Pin-like site-specific DNA recombinase